MSWDPKTPIELFATKSSEDWANGILLPPSPPRSNAKPILIGFGAGILTVGALVGAWMLGRMEGQSLPALQAEPTAEARRAEGEAEKGGERPTPGAALLSSALEWPAPAPKETPTAIAASPSSPPPAELQPPAKKESAPTAATLSPPDKKSAAPSTREKQTKEPKAPHQKEPTQKEEASEMTAPPEPLAPPGEAAPPAPSEEETPATPAETAPPKEAAAPAPKPCPESDPVCALLSEKKESQAEKPEALDGKEIHQVLKSLDLSPCRALGRGKVKVNIHIDASGTVKGASGEGSLGACVASRVRQEARFPSISSQSQTFTAQLTVF